MSEEPKKRGAPTRVSFNPRLSPGQQAEIKAKDEQGDWPEFLQYDGGANFDFRVSPPPWNESQLWDMETNLARMRVDPTASNTMGMDSWALRLLGQCADEMDKRAMADFFFELLHDFGADEIKRVFDEMVRMAKRRQEPAHENFHALKAYHAFVNEFGFDPTQRKLVDFIKDRQADYPIIGKGDAGSSAWWDLFFAAGLSRLVSDPRI